MREEIHPPTPVTTILGRAVPAGTGLALSLGLDVHNDSIAGSLAPSDFTEVRRYGIIGNSHDDVLKLIKKMQAAHPGVFASETGATPVLLSSRLVRRPTMLQA